MQLKKDLIVNWARSFGESHLTGDKVRLDFADGAIPNRFS